MDRAIIQELFLKLRALILRELLQVAEDMTTLSANLSASLFLLSVSQLVLSVFSVFLLTTATLFLITKRELPYYMMQIHSMKLT